MNLERAIPDVLSDNLENFGEKFTPGMVLVSSFVNSRAFDRVKASRLSLSEIGVVLKKYNPYLTELNPEGFDVGQKHANLRN